jgi:sirohydrochlorin ferrochelatase
VIAEEGAMSQALIISHGQPSDPAPAEAALAALAARVAEHLPGWQVGSATLAAPGALDQAVRSLGPQGRAYPLFMAGGWFTRVQIPTRIAATGATGWQVLEPLGCDPAVHDLAVRLVREAAPDSVLLAAHGSFKSAVPSAIARHVAARIAAETGIRAEAAFIDQDPQLEQATGHGPGALCLPFFAAEGGHVTEDIPAALAKAGFQGRVLPALGLAAEIPALIAHAILAGNPVCAQDCRWLGVRAAG